MKQQTFLTSGRLWAFTLVELIVVITILAILGTIGFISLSGYASKARDSARISDMNSIVKVLELSYLKEGFYPETGSGINITYSGSTLWTQGYFNESVWRETRRISQVPLDPLAGGPFVYSVTHNKREYQISGPLESGNALSFVSQAAADFSKAYIKGNYNGALLGKKIDEKMYIFGVPSLITRSINSVSIIDVVRDNLFVLNGYAALPKAFALNEHEASRSISFTPVNPEDIVVFSGSVSELAIQENFLTTASNIFDLYDSSSLESFEPIKNYITLNPQTSEDTEAIGNDLVVKLKNNKSIGPMLGADFKIVLPAMADAFNFIDQINIAKSTQITSNSVTITGLNTGVSVTISGDGNPEFRIDGLAWTTTGNITADQSLELRMTSSASGSTMNSVTVNVGTVSDGWDVTTIDLCSLPWGGEVQSGNVVQAYAVAAPTWPQACSSETRVCQDGSVLSGSFTEQFCVEPPSCSEAGGQIINGVCRFNSSSCPSDWSQASGWATYGPGSSCLSRTFYVDFNRCYSRSGESYPGPSGRAWSNNISVPQRSSTWAYRWVRSGFCSYEGPMSIPGTAPYTCSAKSTDRTQVGCLPR